MTDGRESPSKALPTVAKKESRNRIITDNLDNQPLVIPDSIMESKEFLIQSSKEEDSFSKQSCQLTDINYLLKLEVAF